jgi:ElaB/YqjD/DUF883 family membrane-anchored ribosome-binding protein
MRKLRSIALNFLASDPVTAKYFLDAARNIGTTLNQTRRTDEGPQQSAEQAAVAAQPHFDCSGHERLPSVPPGAILIRESKGHIMTRYQANERLMGDLKLVMQDAEDLLKATGGAAGSKVSEVRNRLGNVLASAKTTYGRVQNKTAGAAKATDRVIRTHTYKSLGIALGVGLLLGVIFARR